MSGAFELCDAAVGSCFDGGVEVELDVGVREDDGALIAAFADEAWVCLADAALFFDEDGADVWDAGDGGDECGDIGFAEAVGEAVAEGDECWWCGGPVEADVCGADEADDGFGVFELEVVVDDDGGGGAVHGAGVEEFEAELVGEVCGNGGFSGACGAVDGDDDALAWRGALAERVAGAGRCVGRCVVVWGVGCHGWLA